MGLCSFKEEDCKPKAINDSEDNPDLTLFCDLYNVDFTSKSIKEEIKKVSKEIKSSVKENFNLKQMKKAFKKEKENKNDEEVIQYKKDLLRTNDLGEGLKILKKALVRCKRTGK